MFGAAALVIAIGLYLPFTLLAPIAAVDPSQTEYSAPVSAAAAVTWPGTGASAIGAVGYPGTLATSGSTDPLPIASISKVVTTLMVLEQKPLAAGESGPTVTFSSADAALYGKYVAMHGKVAGMPIGSQLSELDLMRVVLVVSANNYAEAMATWAYGSVPAFADAAKAWLAKNGLTRTTLVEPTGIDSANQSTASDLVALGKLALANPVVASIVSLPSVTYPGVGTYANTNELLGVSGIDGIKTGTLDSAGSMLLFAADYTVGTHTVTLVGAVLGGVDRDSLNSAVRSLVDTAEAGFHEITLAAAGQAFANYDTAWGDSAHAVTATDAAAVVWGTTAVTSRVTLDPVRQAAQGTRVGNVSFTVGSQVISVPLQLTSTISDPGPLWRLVHPLEAFGVLPG